MLGKFFGNVIGNWQISLAIFALLAASFGGVYWWGYSNGRAAELNAQIGTVGKAVDKGQQADTASHQTVTNHNADVKAGNDAAKKAAQGSKDPLRDGLNALGGRK